MANNLAELIISFLPGKAAELYKMAIEAGDERYAPCNLGWLIAERNPELGKHLIKRSIAAGNKSYAVNVLGLVTAREDPEAARSLFEQALAAGDVAAQINLAHTFIPTYPERSSGLYTGVLDSQDPEALLGLAFLLRHKDPEKARTLCNKASESLSLKESLIFLIQFLSYYDEATAIEFAHYVRSQGFKSAENALIALRYGGSYEYENAVLEFGRDCSGNPIEWIVAHSEENRLLLVSKKIIASMAYSDDGSNAKWDSSAIKTWLNSEFLLQSFTKEERDCIVDSPDARGYVFCLSISEFEELYTDPGLRRRLRGTLGEKPDARKWWLRVENASTLSAPYVLEDDYVGWGLARLDYGVRPAIYVKL